MSFKSIAKLLVLKTQAKVAFVMASTGFKWCFPPQAQEPSLHGVSYLDSFTRAVLHPRPPRRFVARAESRLPRASP
jgi:hypothetical protein